MEIEDPPITNQKDQMPKVAILDAPFTMEVEPRNGNEGNEYEVGMLITNVRTYLFLVKRFLVKREVCHVCNKKYCSFFQARSS